NGFGIGPLDTIGVGEESDLFVRGQHFQPLRDDLTNRVGEKIVPPVDSQGAKGLIGVAAREKTLKAQPGMPGDHFGDLANCLLGEAASSLKREWLRAEAELENDFVPVLFEAREKS